MMADGTDFRWLLGTWGIMFILTWGNIAVSDQRLIPSFILAMSFSVLPV